jgi:hypothetical protein
VSLPTSRAAAIEEIDALGEDVIQSGSSRT